MESINRKAIIIAILFAFITSLLIYKYIDNMTQPDIVTEEDPEIEVYIAASDLLAKHKITEEDIEMILVPNDVKNSAAILNEAEIIGKRLKENIYKGEQILRSRLVSEDEELILAFNIPKGKRAISMNVSEQALVGNNLRPGDYVDVVASAHIDVKPVVPEGQTADIKKIMASKVFVQNVLVLAIGEKQKIVEDEEPGEIAQTLTVAVDPKDVEKVVTASEFGNIRLALRPVGDNTIIDTDGVKIEDVLGEVVLN